MERINVESNSFEEGKEMPSKYTCDGADASPHLKWEPVNNAKAYALKIDDPDAPAGTWVHWILVNIPAEKTELEVGETAGKEIQNSFGKTNYGGPCPPSGTHRYYFKLYALDTKLEGVTAKNFDEEVEKHAVGKGELMCTYTKKEVSQPH